MRIVGVLIVIAVDRCFAEPVNVVFKCPCPLTVFGIMVLLFQIAGFVVLVGFGIIPECIGVVGVNAAAVYERLVTEGAVAADSCFGLHIGLSRMFAARCVDKPVNGIVSVAVQRLYLFVVEKYIGLRIVFYLAQVANGIVGIAKVLQYITVVAGS